MAWMFSPSIHPCMKHLPMCPWLEFDGLKVASPASARWIAGIGSWGHLLLGLEDGNWEFMHDEPDEFRQNGLLFWNLRQDLNKGVVIFRSDLHSIP